MPQSISDFYSSFVTGLAKPSRFEVSITAPTGLPSTPINLMYRCESAELPSRTYATTEQKFGSNPIEKYPYQVTFNDLTLTFMVGGDMKEKEFFDKWMELVVPSSNYNPKYKYSYVATIRITQFDSTGKPTYAVDLIDAYPITVNQLDLDWSAEGYHKLSVVFAYTYWEKIDNPLSEEVRTNKPQPSESVRTTSQGNTLGPMTNPIDNNTPNQSSGVSQIGTIGPISNPVVNNTPDQSPGPIFVPLIR